MFLQLLENIEARDDLAKEFEQEYSRQLLAEAMARVRLRVAPPTWEAFRLTALDGLPGAAAGQRLGDFCVAGFLAQAPRPETSETGDGETRLRRWMSRRRLARSRAANVSASTKIGRNTIEQNRQASTRLTCIGINLPPRRTMTGCPSRAALDQFLERTLDPQEKARDRVTH